MQKVLETWDFKHAKESPAQTCSNQWIEKEVFNVDELQGAWENVLFSYQKSLITKLSLPFGFGEGVLLRSSI